MFADAPSQKMALQFLHALVNKWMSAGGGPTLTNGVTFMQFTTEHIVPACFAAVLAPDFNMEDAQSGHQVVSEIASIHTGMLSAICLCVSVRAYVAAANPCVRTCLLSVVCVCARRS